MTLVRMDVQRVTGEVGIDTGHHTPRRLSEGTHAHRHLRTFLAASRPHIGSAIRRAVNATPPAYPPTCEPAAPFVENSLCVNGVPSAAGPLTVERDRRPRP